jgi:hypothetical protein
MGATIGCSHEPKGSIVELFGKIRDFLRSRSNLRPHKNWSIQTGQSENQNLGISLDILDNIDYPLENIFSHNRALQLYPFACSAISPFPDASSANVFFLKAQYSRISRLAEWAKRFFEEAKLRSDEAVIRQVEVRSGRN